MGVGVGEGGESGFLNFEIFCAHKENYPGPINQRIDTKICSFLIKYILKETPSVVFQISKFFKKIYTSNILLKFFFRKKWKLENPLKGFP